MFGNVSPVIKGRWPLLAFAFINFPMANLFSIGGLPVEPFRTDRPYFLRSCKPTTTIGH